MSKIASPSTTVDSAFGSSVTIITPGTAEGRTLVPVEIAGYSWLAPIADLMTSYAYMSLLDVSQSCVTVNLRMDFTGVETDPGQSLPARAWLLPTTSPTALTQCQIDTVDGRPIAVATARSALIANPGRAHGFETAPALGGFDDLRRVADLESVESSDHAASFTITPADLLGNPSRVLHGGAQITLAELAIVDWMRVTRPRVRSSLISISAEYLAPILVDGKPVAVELSAVRVGRSMARINVSVLTPHGDIGTFIAATFGLTSLDG